MKRKILMILILLTMAFSVNAQDETDVPIVVTDVPVEIVEEVPVIVAPVETKSIVDPNIVLGAAAVLAVVLVGVLGTVAVKAMDSTKNSIPAEFAKSLIQSTIPKLGEIATKQMSDLEQYVKASPEPWDDVAFLAGKIPFEKAMELIKSYGVQITVEVEEENRG